MITPADFKTKTIMLERKNIMTPDAWGIALDIGYSSVKGFSPNSIYCFPSYAKKISSEVLSLGQAGPNDIQYRDKTTNELWYVGALAQDMTTSDASNESIAALYGRNRYFSPMFKVIARVGLALGMIANNFGNPAGKNLVLQTGLPPAYLKSDTDLIKEALSGTHEFEIKIGARGWKQFSFTLPEENIRVMAQPMGTLLSISTDSNGKLIPEAKKYFSSHLLILDPGFGTLDYFDLKNKVIDSYDTFDNLGMKRVLQETTAEIFRKYKAEISVPAMQKFLQEGMVVSFDRKERKTTKVPFDDILEEANKSVCLEALSQISTIFNDLVDHNYLVVTGGTGAAWKNIIKEYYSGMETLSIINGNQNDTLPFIFSNVRGYYMYQYGKLEKLSR